ncbi:MAG: DUF2807 domain-containing protein [Burkholderiales bacterium]|nr:DUF2807 domain-containing protein [Burkholderiales bacterium]
MKNIIRTGTGMLALALVLSGAPVAFMPAHAAGAAPPQSAAGSESRAIAAGVVNVIMNGPIDLRLRQSATPELLVKGDPKLVARITTRVDGNTLYVGTRGIFIAIGAQQASRIELSLPNLEKLQMQGSGDANLIGLRGQRIELVLRGSGDLVFDGDYQQVQASLSGSGDLRMSLGNAENVELSMLGAGNASIKGQARALRAKIDGTGDLDSTALKAQQVSLSSMGASDAKIFASQEVKIKLMGSGDAQVYGNPARRNVERIGSGDIRWE